MFRVLWALLFSAVAWNATAQNFPAKPVRLIVPFAAAGPADIQARLIGPKLTEAWGQPVVVENRAGGNTIIATELTARTDPDGHTVLVVSAGFAINVSLYAKLPYDSLRDFTPVTQLTSGPAIVVVHPSLPVRSVKELIQLARSRPGQLTYASAGLPSQLAVELFKVVTGTDLVHVPYKGAAPAMIDLIAGHVRERPDDGGKAHLHVAGDEIDHRRRRALVRHVDKVGTGHDLEQLDGELAGQPGGCVSQLPGAGSRQLYQFLDGAYRQRRMHDHDRRPRSELGDKS